VADNDTQCPECFGGDLKVVSIRDLRGPRRKGETASAERPVVARKVEVVCRRCKWSGFLLQRVGHASGNTASGRRIVTDRVAAFVEQYKAAGLNGTPCRPADVEALEAEAGVHLPAAYRAYLLLMGLIPDPLFTGTDCSLHHLHGLREAADELLAENGRPFELPPVAFVFLMHQGYQFMYFVCGEATDDPPVYHYMEGEPVAVRKAERFSEWLESCAKEA